jgi:CheY-like chemotaxis protein
VIDSKPEELNTQERSAAQTTCCALLVEDSHHDEWLFRRAMEAVGRHVRLSSARDGDEAIAYLAGVGVYGNRAVHPLPSIVLLDIKLPRQSGFDVLHWVRASGGDLRQLPVVMMSTSARDRDVRQAYELGANAYVVKPDTYHELETCVDQIFGFWCDVNRSTGPRCS